MPQGATVSWDIDKYLTHYLRGSTCGHTFQGHLPHTRGAEAVVREGLSEVLTSHLGPEGSMGISQLKREWGGEGETHPGSRTPRSFWSRARVAKRKR